MFSVNQIATPIGSPFLHSITPLQNHQLQLLAQLESLLLGPFALDQLEAYVRGFPTPESVFNLLSAFKQILHDHTCSSCRNKTEAQENFLEHCWQFLVSVEKAFLQSVETAIIQTFTQSLDRCNRCTCSVFGTLLDECVFYLSELNRNLIPAQFSGRHPFYDGQKFGEPLLSPLIVLLFSDPGMVYDAACQSRLLEYLVQNGTLIKDSLRDLQINDLSTADAIHFLNGYFLRFSSSKYVVSSKVLNCLEFLVSRNHPLFISQFANSYLDKLEHMAGEGRQCITESREQLLKHASLLLDLYVGLNRKWHKEIFAYPISEVYIQFGSLSKGAVRHEIKDLIQGKCSLSITLPADSLERNLENVCGMPYDFLLMEQPFVLHLPHAFVFVRTQAGKRKSESESEPIKRRKSESGPILENVLSKMEGSDAEVPFPSEAVSIRQMPPFFRQAAEIRFSDTPPFAWNKELWIRLASQCTSCNIIIPLGCVCSKETFQEPFEWPIVSSEISLDVVLQESDLELWKSTPERLASYLNQIPLRRIVFCLGSPENDVLCIQVLKHIRKGIRIGFLNGLDSARKHALLQHAAEGRCIPLFRYLLNSGAFPLASEKHFTEPSYLLTLLEVLTDSLPFHSKLESELSLLFCRNLTPQRVPSLSVEDQNRLKKLIDFYFFEKKVFPCRSWIRRHTFASYPFLWPHLRDRLLDWFKKADDLGSMEEIATAFNCLAELRLNSVQEEEDPELIRLIKKYAVALEHNCLAKRVRRTDADKALIIFLDLFRRRQNVLPIVAAVKKLVKERKGKLIKCDPAASQLAMYVSFLELSEEDLSLCLKVVLDKSSTECFLQHSITPKYPRALEGIWHLLGTDASYSIPYSLFSALWKDAEASFQKSPESPSGQTLQKSAILLKFLMEKDSDQALQCTGQILDFIQRNPTLGELFLRTALETVLLAKENEALVCAALERKPFSILLGNLFTLSDEAQKVLLNAVLGKECGNRSQFYRQPIVYHHFLKKALKDIAILGRSASSFFFSLPPPQLDVELGKLLFAKLAPLKEDEIFAIYRTYQYKMADYLGRELNEEERFWVDLSRKNLSKEAASTVRRFIETPTVDPLVASNAAAELNFIVQAFDSLQFEEADAVNYCAPELLKIDGKTIPPSTFRECLLQLVKNVVNRTKITAAPDDLETREAVYKDLENFLLHITRLMHFRKPWEMTAVFLALGEIGAKCFTQYTELPSLFYSFRQQIDAPIMPHTLAFDTLDATPISSGGISCGELVEGQPIVFERDSVKETVCSASLTKYEVAAARVYLPEKLKMLRFLISLLPIEMGEKFSSGLVGLRSDSLQLLIARMDEIESKLSLSWLLSYAQLERGRYPSLSGTVVSVIQARWEGSHHPLDSVLNQCGQGLYALPCKSISQALNQLEHSLKIGGSCEDALSYVQRCRRCELPTTFKDKILLFIHELKWKIFRDLIAKLPDLHRLNIHEVKYIEGRMRQKFGIFQANTVGEDIHDPHVLPETKKIVAKMHADFLLAFNPYFLVKKFQEAIGSEFGYADVIDWFKANCPEGINVENFEAELFDEEYQVKPTWVLYLLMKMNILIEPSN